MTIFCQCCLNKCDDKVNMSSPVNNQGILEVYEEMLQYSAGIQLLKDGNLHYICKTCIYQLQQYCIFKNQVQETQYRLSINASKIHIEKEPSPASSPEPRLEPSPEPCLEPSYEPTYEDNNYDNFSLSSPESDDSDLFRPLNKPAETPSSTELKCLKCTAIFYNKEEHEVHTKSCNSRCLCSYCGKTYDTNNKLRVHLESHKQKVQCEICNKFIGHGGIKVHINTVHNKTLHYRCFKCPERFSHHLKKQRHMVQVHGADPQVYPCHHCSRTFNRCTIRNQHVRRVHLHEKNVTCSVCKMSFFSKSTLKDHMEVHTQEKKYECNFCHKCYSRKKTLKEHLKIHYNIKNHICHTCGTAFTQKCSLNSHMKTHHK